MNAEALVEQLEGCGVRLEAHGDRLRWQAPEGVLTSDLLRELQEHKAEVLVLLRRGTPPDMEEVDALVAAWRGAARELSELAGYPRVQFKPAHSVPPGAAHWGTFIARASVPDLRLAVAALRQLLTATPEPGGQG